jgi:methyl-accepting chemotaxis protein
MSSKIDQGMKPISNGAAAPAQTGHRLSAEPGAGGRIRRTHRRRQPAAKSPKAEGGQRAGMRIRTKLLASFGVVLVLGAAVGFVGTRQAGLINAKSALLYQRDLAGMGEIAVLGREVLSDHADVLRRMQKSGVEGSAIEAEINGYDQEVSATVEQIVNLNTNPEVRSAVASFQSAWNSYRRIRDGQVMPAIEAGATAQVTKLVNGPLEQQAITMINTLDELISAQRQDAQRTERESVATFKTARRLIVGMTLAAVLIGLLVAFLLSGRLARNAGAVAGAAGKVAEGDLSQRATVRGGDEIAELAASFNAMAEQLERTVDAERTAKGQLEDAVRQYVAFAERVAGGDLTARLHDGSSKELATLTTNLNGMVGSLAKLSGEVRTGATRIGGAAAEILAAVNEHGASVTEQSAALTQTSATVEQLRAASGHTSHKAQEVAQLAKDSVQVSEDGTHSVEAIEVSMQEIREKVEGIARDILALSEQTQAISEITATVNDLADQSNLLALNASIEAAKAGEQGKGFGVVAGEIRTLAEQSKQATTQVRTILSDIQKAANTAVLATEQGTRVVQNGMGMAQRAGEVIRQLAETISRSSQAAQQIAASAHQQNVGMDQIALAMTDVNSSTSQLVAWAQQSQSAAESLNELAGQLQAMTESYKV